MCHLKTNAVVSSIQCSPRLATAEDDRLIYPVQQDYVEHASPVWNNGNHTDNNNNNNWDEKTRVLGSAQCDNSTCDKSSSLFPSSPSPTSSSPCSPGSLCRHSYCKHDNISIAHLPIFVVTAAYHCIAFSDDCCAKVAASKLLEHWLDAPNPPDLPQQLSFPEELLKASDPLPGLRRHFTGSPNSSNNLLHLVLSKHSTLTALPSLVRVLVSAHPGDNLTTDDHGDTGLTMVRHILDAGLVERAQMVAETLLEHGADPRHRNMCGWSLLAYSLSHQDVSIELTRTLLNHDAYVLPASSVAVTSSSPFRVFLSSVVRSQSLANAGETLALLGEVMGRLPARMKAHVPACLLAEARYPNLHTLAVFREVQERLAPYWSSPSSLLHLSLHASRRRLGLKRLNSGKLGVAPRLANYLSFRLTLRAPNTPHPSNSQDSTTQKTEPPQYQEPDLLSANIRRRLATPT